MRPMQIFSLSRTVQRFANGAEGGRALKNRDSVRHVVTLPLHISDRPLWRDPGLRPCPPSGRPLRWLRIVRAAERHLGVERHDVGEALAEQLAGSTTERVCSV